MVTSLQLGEMDTSMKAHSKELKFENQQLKKMYIKGYLKVKIAREAIASWLI